MPAMSVLAGVLDARAFSSEVDVRVGAARAPALLDARPAGGARHSLQREFGGLQRNAGAGCSIACGQWKT